MKIRRPIIILNALLGASIGAAIWFARGIVDTWHHNPIANSAILGLSALGLLYTFFCALNLWKGQRQWQRLEKTEGHWTDGQRLKGVMSFFNGRLEHELGSVNVHHRNRAILAFEDSLNLRVRMAEYLAGLLIGLGLLGTFIGLMATMGSIGGVLSSLNGTGGVKQMLESLSMPLAGMASAFSASLMGLLGSLLMGAVAQFMADANDNLVQRIKSWSQRAESQDDVQQGSDDDLALRQNALSGPRLDAQGQQFFRHYAHQQAEFQANMLDASREMAKRLCDLGAQMQTLAQLGQAQLGALGVIKDAFRTAEASLARSAGALDENRVAVAGAVRGLTQNLTMLAQAGQGTQRQLESIDQAIVNGATHLSLMTQSVVAQQDASLELVRHVSTLASKQAPTLNQNQITAGA